LLSLIVYSTTTLVDWVLTRWPVIVLVRCSIVILLTPIIWLSPGWKPSLRCLPLLTCLLLTRRLIVLSRRLRSLDVFEVSIECDQLGIHTVGDRGVPIGSVPLIVILRVLGLLVLAFKSVTLTLLRPPTSIT
jgi:hypothetical protein